MAELENEAEEQDDAGFEAVNEPVPAFGAVDVASAGGAADTEAFVHAVDEAEWDGVVDGHEVVGVSAIEFEIVAAP